MIAPVLWLFLAAADPCAPVTADLPPDPGTAAIYRDIARGEEASGALESAAVAYREALRRDGGDPATRAALTAICRRVAVARRFEEGVARLRARDWTAAAAALAEARAGGLGASAALLQGVALMELGEDARAEEAFSAAAQDPRTRSAARFHQGLLALRAGSAAQAVEAFEDSAETGALSPVAVQLARQARMLGRLVIVASAGIARDSNPTLDDQAPTPDQAWSAGLLALVRPSGRWGPYLRGEALLHRYWTSSELNLGSYRAAAGWQLGRDALGGVAEYELGVRTLGDRPYLTAHRGLVSGWLATGSVLWSSTALVRVERFATDWDPLSGVVARAELRAETVLGRAARVGLSYGAARDWTDTAALSWLEHGPRGDLQLLLGSRLVLLAEVGAAWRAADGYDAVLGATREDRVLDGALSLEWDVRHGLFLRVGVAGQLARSTVAAYSYETWTPSLGLRYVFGR
jgi:hypothetical protein